MILPGGGGYCPRVEDIARVGLECHTRVRVEVNASVGMMLMVHKGMEGHAGGGGGNARVDVR